MPTARFGEGGASMSRNVYALPREIANAVGFLADASDRPMVDRYAQAKVEIELQSRIVDALVRLAKAGRIVYGA